jgi:hypothetical protein
MLKYRFYTFFIVLTLSCASYAGANCKDKSKEIAKNTMVKCLQRTQCSIVNLFDKKCSKKIKNLKKECLKAANAEAESYLRRCAK